MELLEIVAQIKAGGPKGLKCLR